MTCGHWREDGSLGLWERLLEVTLLVTTYLFLKVLLTGDGAHQSTDRPCCTEIRSIVAHGRPCSQC